MPEKLRAVLANFGYSEKVILLTPHSARCVTLSCVSQFWIFEKFSKIFRKINIWTLCRFPGDGGKCSKAENICLTLRCDRLRWGRLRAVTVSQFGIYPNLIFWLRALLACAKSLFSRISLRKWLFQQNHFSLFIRGRGGLVSYEKIAKQYHDTDTLNCFESFASTKC